MFIKASASREKNNIIMSSDDHSTTTTSDKASDEAINIINSIMENIDGKKKCTALSRYHQ